MQKQPSLIFANLSCLLFLFTLLSLQVHAQRPKDHCFLFLDYHMEAVDISVLMDYLPDLIDELQDVDEWEDEGEKTVELGRKDALAALRSDWRLIEDSLTGLRRKWREMAHLVVKPNGMDKTYRKASKYLDKSVAAHRAGGELLDQSLEKWERKRRVKALFSLRKLQSKCQVAMNKYAVVSMPLEDICNACYPSYDTFE